MKEFFDTSVLVAAFWAKHTAHGASLRALAGATKAESACGLHTVAEVYATMSALPVQPVIPTEQVLLFIEEICARLTLVSLTENEFLKTVRRTGERGLTSGTVYDSLLLECASKWGARTIYTLNLKHFQAIAPHLANRIRRP